jgi:hypothetical protein
MSSQDKVKEDFMHGSTKPKGKKKEITTEKR